MVKLNRNCNKNCKLNLFDNLEIYLKSNLKPFWNKYESYLSKIKCQIMLFCFIIKPSNHLVAMEQSIVEFKIRVFRESLSKLSPKRRVLVLMVLLNSNMPYLIFLILFRKVVLSCE